MKRDRSTRFPESNFEARFEWSRQGELVTVPAATQKTRGHWCRHQEALILTGHFVECCTVYRMLSHITEYDPHESPWEGARLMILFLIFKEETEFLSKIIKLVETRWQIPILSRPWGQERREPQRGWHGLHALLQDHVTLQISQYPPPTHTQFCFPQFQLSVIGPRWSKADDLASEGQQ